MRRLILPVGAAILVCSVRVAAQERPRITSREAPQHVGEEVTVCGRVTAYGCDAARGSLLHLDGPAIETPFQIVVSNSDRQKFGTAFESGLDQRQVCGTGRIERSERDYRLSISDPDALRVEDAAPAGDRAVVVFTPCDGGVALPKVVHSERPQYTAEARQSGVTGRVTVQAIVAEDGSVRDARIVHSLDESLDDAALRAARLWRFSPGTRDGLPAPVAVKMEMTFTLR